MHDSSSLTFRVAGVPEHFNAPWQLALEGDDFARRPYAVEWRAFPGGTGAMCEALAQEEVEVAVLLTEGIVAALLQGLNAKIVGTYVDSPLFWGIHVPATSPYTTPEQLAGLPFAISRFGSGSHLMTYVEAEARGWLAEREPRFVKVGDIEGARRAMAQGEAVGFLWERLMTRPLVEAGEWRQIGVRPSPWPAFLIAARHDVIAQHGDKLQDLMHVVQRRCHEMRAARVRTRRTIAERFGLNPAEVERWLDETRWRCAPEVSLPALQDAVGTLHRVGVIDTLPQAIDLVATEVCEPGKVLPQMMYDIRIGGVRDALAQAGHAFGPLPYEKLAQLGQFDQHYDVGLDSSFQMAKAFGLGPDHRILEVGSRLGAVARALAHHTGAQLTGIELQPALNAVAKELTARCGMEKEVEFLTGDASHIPLPPDRWDTLCSFMVMLHVGDRVSAWENLAPALKPGAGLWIEDLVLQTENLDPEDERVIHHVLGAPRLVTAATYAQELEGAGLPGLHQDSLTQAWVQGSQERLTHFMQHKEGHLRAHGPEVFEARRRFLAVMQSLFAGGVLGGVRFWRAPVFHPNSAP